MPELTDAAPQKPTGSFAALLASITGCAKKGCDEWDDSELADDVTTISYEQALRAHRRVRSSAFATETLHEEFPAPAVVSSTLNRNAAGEKERKIASITLRLTTPEHAQLQERAAAAHLSVSAYLRSCIFEAESLRSQVKEALSQIRASTSVEPAPSGRELPASARHRPFHFFPRWSHRKLKAES